MVSAMKVGGRKLYELAREGEEVERAPRPVRIDALDVEDFAAGPVSRRRRSGSSARAARTSARSRPTSAPRSAAARTSASCGGCGSASFTLDEAHVDRRDRGRPRRGRADAARRDARSRTRRASTPNRRAPSPHGATFAAPALLGDRRRATGRSRSSTTRGALLAVYERRGGGREAGGRARDRRRGVVKIYRDPAEVADRRRRGPRGHDRRVRRRAPRSSGGAAARPRPRAGPRALARRCSRSTAIRPRSCGPSSAPKLLTTLEQKLELLEATGAVDECLVLPFDATRSKEPAEQFVEELLASALRARLVVVGADFHFGYRRHGDVPLLQRMGAELGFETIGLGLVAAPDARRRRPVLVDARPRAARRGRRRGRGRDPRPPARGARARSSTATPAVASSASRPRTSACPSASACPPTASTRARSSAPTASSGPPRSRSAAARRSTPTPACCCSRRYVLDFDGDLYDQAARVAVHAPPPGPGALRAGRRPRRPDAPRRRTGPGPRTRPGPARRVW